MIKLKCISTLKKTMFFVSTIFFAACFSACETKINFLTSSVVPAARGSVTVKKDNNNNYKMHISVSDLAESTRLTPSKATYVVWIVGSSGNNAQNIGQIQTSDLSASLETVSPYKPSKIFITAEDAGNVQYPGQTILTTASF